mmetsp:Transcript_25872/g.43656  ORF Transcript_25872/g.43656 Transcript_25872/m.43656 type:complete len:535 (+) Transcript_25872:334-1938(+)|eukprot:CAMPEP_0114427286 /NCGR_PEP_ID=MMETSP0103-20121206/8260_1 /TAXON_ID=37642 ORGANISM="Paraphysomonas imperforata, Strain PA2" /NCGR_SAMPLE_ID=MMETSP0103 /ASSEMBLY_ACC=CAM_ASM_000201 /LENGTH=534 /DNA_ID=CAMNT_0001596323 /DNA_START=317 /DNA_END=1921 /DNA_ORIENTATION=-
MLNGISFFLGLGVVGLTNLTVLCLIAIYRTFIYLNTQRRLRTLDEFTTQKKVLLHVLLVLAVAVDLPMYVSFIVIEDYNYITYSFHKFQPMFLLAAYSIIINDWSSVLYSIQEIRRLPLVFRTGFLVFLNAVFSLFCFFNFVLIIAVRDVDKYAGTVTYRISILLQISVTLALTLFMLHAGLGLSRRLQGVSGMLGEARPRADTRTGQLSSTPSAPGLGFGFKTALNRLIVVMTTCSICIFIQLTLMIINYTAGYADQNTTPGPHLFYWTFYAWLPLWGPILSMLHLSRSRVNKADDYDTASHRAGLGSSPGGKKSRLRGGKSEYSVRDGSARLLDDVERGDASSEEEDVDGQSPVSSSLSQQGRLLGQLSQHSHTSGKSAASGSTTASTRPQSSVYRPPDYPSSLFRRAGDEEFEASSCESDSVYLDERLTSRTTNSLLSTDFLEGSNNSARVLIAQSGHELNYDHHHEGEEVEECGSSEDDHHAHRYDSYFSGMSGDQGVPPRTGAISLRLTGDDFSSLLHPDGDEDSGDKH